MPKKTFSKLIPNQSSKTNKNQSSNQKWSALMGPCMGPSMFWYIPSQWSICPFCTVEETWW